MSETATLALVPTLTDTMNLGGVLAKSGYFQDARDAAQAVVKVLAGQEVGLPPIASMTGIYIVKGRVTFSATTMAALIKRSGKYDYRVIEHTDKVCELAFFEAGREVGRSRFTFDDATTAGLTGNPTWRQFPRNMLLARAMSNGAKWYCPEVFGGPVYTPDELREAIPEDAPVVAPSTPSPVTEVQATASVVDEAIAPKAPSYDSFGAITMITKMGGGAFKPEALEAYFGPGIRTKTRLDKYAQDEAELFRSGYDRLHADYIAFKTSGAEAS